MRKLLSRLTMFAALAVPATVTAANVSDFIDFSLKSGSTTLLPGRLFVPPEVAAAPNTSRPFILFLHGGGESGTNNTAQVNANIDNLLAEAKRRGAFLYAPQTANNWSSAAITDRVVTMLDRALAEQHMDPNRVYVTGLSNGGGGTWNMLSRYDDRFAAAIPICGVAPAADFVPSRLIDDAIIAFHARNDNIVSVGTTRSVLNRILDAAGETRPTYPTSSSDPPVFVFASGQHELAYVEPADGGHGIWPAVYSIPELYDWLFAHSLAVPEPQMAQLVAAALGFVLAHRPARALSRVRQSTGVRLQRTSPSAGGVRPRT